MTTAHEQYYTQPEAEAVHISYEVVRRLGWEYQNSDFTPTLWEKAVEFIANESDGWQCKFCDEPVGWHWFQAGDTDACAWSGDFWSLNEDSSEVACDGCFIKVTAEPDYGDEPEEIFTLQPHERAIIDFIETLAFDPKKYI
jgi:hypothetical protein